MGERKSLQNTVQDFTLDNSTLETPAQDGISIRWNDKYLLFYSITMIIIVFFNHVTSKNIFHNFITLL